MARMAPPKKDQAKPPAGAQGGPGGASASGQPGRDSFAKGGKVKRLMKAKRR